MLSSQYQEEIDTIRDCINIGYGKHNAFGQWEQHAGKWGEEPEVMNPPMEYGDRWMDDEDSGVGEEAIQESCRQMEEIGLEDSDEDEDDCPPTKSHGPPTTLENRATA